MDNHIDTALILAKDNLIEAEKIEYPNGKAVNLYLLAYIHQYKGDNQTAINYSNESIKISKKIQNDKNLADVYNLLSQIYIDKGEQDLALSYNLKSLKIQDSIRDKKGMIVSLTNIGNTYSFQKKYSEAINNYNNAIYVAENIKDFTKIAICMNNIGDIYKQQKEYNRALSYYERALKLKNSIHTNQRIIITLFSNIGGIYMRQKKYFTGLPYLYESLKLSQKLNYNMGIVQASIKIAQLYTEINYLDSAKKYAFISLENENVVQSKSYKQQSYFILYKIEKKQKNFGEAIKYYEQSVQLNDSIFNEDKERILGELQNKYKIEQQNQQIKLLKQENNNENLQRNFSFIISHNIRSPIAHILGLVNIFNVADMNDPFNLEILSHLERSGKNLEMVIKDLSKIISIRNSLDTTKEEVSFNSELNITLEHLTEQISSCSAKIEYIFNAESVISVKGYVQSIFYNLISNAIKYKARYRSPIIYVRTEIVGNFVCLSVQDNGLGIDLANTDMYKIFGLYQRMHNHVQGKGLGLFLVKTQIESLGGRIELDSKLDVGSAFNVYFPV